MVDIYLMHAVAKATWMKQINNVDPVSLEDIISENDFS